MLKELTIRNLAVIESVRLTFHEGFHVLTGETGAGKSIIIDALGLIAGGRSQSGLVRYGQEKAEIEALFEMPVGHPVWETLAAQGIEPEEEDMLIIRREIGANGKSISRINGHLVNLATLREVGAWLINIHGQHEHQSLLNPEQHIEWLDLFGGEELLEARAAYQAAYEEYLHLAKQWKEWKLADKETLQMQDLYRFQLEEIAAAQLKPGEDEALAEERTKLANAEKLYQNILASYEALYDNGRALDLIRTAISKLQDVVPFDPAVLQPIYEQVQGAFYQLEDAAYQLRDYRDGIEFNPVRLDEIERRLELISSLRRKYGDSVAEILAYGEQIRKQLADLDRKEEKLAELEKLIRDQLQLCSEKAVRLSELRQQAGERLAALIEQELRFLHMERTKFRVSIAQIDDPKGLKAFGRKVKFGRMGIDQVEFLISPNPGEPLRELAKIASGGELSRIMLAMKSIFATVDRIPVLVFDEVDTGVSGRAAQAIAERMVKLSATCQVFSITHLPQVACMADAHYSISKTVEGDRTFTHVEDLTPKRRTEELARMLGGVEITPRTLSHAEEMLALANSQKSTLRKGS